MSWGDLAGQEAEQAIGAAALGSLETFAHHMGLGDQLRDALETNAKRRRASA